MADEESALERWLAVVARCLPRLARTLAPPASAEAIAAISAQLGRPMPPALAALYARHDGQTHAHPQPLFGETYFLPLSGIDSVAAELAYAPPGELPFGKDFGGTSHALVVDAPGEVVLVDDGGTRTVVASSFGAFLDGLADGIEAGTLGFDDREEQTATFVIDAPAALAVDAAVAAPDLARAGITMVRVADDVLAQAGAHDGLGFFVELPPHASVDLASSAGGHGSFGVPRGGRMVRVHYVVGAVQSLAVTLRWRE